MKTIQSSGLTSNVWHYKLGQIPMAGEGCPPWRGYTIVALVNGHGTEPPSRYLPVCLSTVLFSILEKRLQEAAVGQH